MTPAPHSISVRSAGSTAATMLQSGSPLTVAAVFERSFYCRDSDDRWLCFLRDDLEPGPLHALATGWPEQLGDHVFEGQTLAAAGRSILATPTFTVEFSEFLPWQPTTFPPVNPPLLRDALLRLRQAMRRLAPPDTLAGQLVGCKNSHETDDGWQKAVLAETSRGLDMVTRWLASPSDDSLRDAVQALVGLGPGLTPTGDDILAGTLLTLHALRQTERAAALATAINEWGVEGTNRISLAHLRAAAAGQGAAPFHDMLNGLLRCDATFEPYLWRIDAVGHSSGWDILTGIVTTLESCIQPAPR